MGSHDNPLWLKLWHNKQTDFHQLKVNTLLQRFWFLPDHIKGSRVFVPLCGKSLDMIWLAEQGNEVIGVELSPIAVKSFFDENHLKPTKTQVGEFTLWKTRNISILCGDYFSLRKTDLGQIDTVYDRAALTALPEDIRSEYVAKLRKIIDRKTRVLLLTIEDADDNATMDQALGIDAELESLYSKYFSIEVAHVESVIESDAYASGEVERRVEYKAYKLARL